MSQYNVRVVVSMATEGPDVPDWEVTEIVEVTVKDPIAAGRAIAEFVCDQHSDPHTLPRD